MKEQNTPKQTVDERGNKFKLSIDLFPQVYNHMFALLSVNADLFEDLEFQAVTCTLRVMTTLDPENEDILPQYISRTANNARIDVLRSRAVREKYGFREDPWPESERDEARIIGASKSLGTVDTYAESVIFHQELQELTRGLSDNHKQILSLIAEGYTVDEIAETLRIDKNAVKSRLNRARKNVRVTRDNLGLFDNMG